MCATVQAKGVKDLVTGCYRRAYVCYSPGDGSQRPRDRVLQSVDGCQNPGDVSQRPRRVTEVDMCATVQAMGVRDLEMRCYRRGDVCHSPGDEC